MSDTLLMQELSRYAKQRLQNDPSFRGSIYAISATTSKGRIELARLAANDPSPDVRDAALHALTGHSGVLESLVESVRPYQNRLQSVINHLARPVDEIMEWLRRPPQEMDVRRELGYAAPVGYASSSSQPPTIAKGTNGTFHWWVADEGIHGLWLMVDTTNEIMEGAVLLAIETGTIDRDDGGNLGLLAMRPSDKENGTWEGRLRLDDIAVNRAIASVTLTAVSPNETIDIQVAEEYRAAATNDDPASLPDWDRWLEHARAVNVDDEDEIFEVTDESRA